MKKLFGALTLAALLASGSAYAADVFEYNFQTVYSGPHVLNLQYFQPVTEEIKAESDGRLVLHFFQSATLVKPEEALPALKNGTVDIISFGSTYQETLFPHSYLYNMPYLVKDCVQSSALYWKIYNELPEVKAEWDKHGKILTIWGSDRTGIYSVKGPILSPADMQGKRVLFWSGGLADQIKAWGGTPVQITPNDTYIALQRGMGDAFFGPLPAGVAFKLLEVAKDVTILPTFTQMMVNGVSWDVWNELPTDLQDLLYAKLGGEENSIKTGRILYDATDRDIETMKAAGCTIHDLSDEQRMAFQDADRGTIMPFWISELKRIGNPDPEGAIKRAYELGAALPPTQ